MPRGEQKFWEKLGGGARERGGGAREGVGGEEKTGNRLQSIPNIFPNSVRPIFGDPGAVDGHPH